MAETASSNDTTATHKMDLISQQLPEVQVRRVQAVDRSQRAYGKKSSERDDRREALQDVYRLFDLDGSGRVGKGEMFVLGQWRRKLGQREGEWTQDMNDTMMANMGVDSFGNINMRSFVKYFDEKLPHIPKDFADTIAQFTACASDLRHRIEPKIVSGGAPELPALAVVSLQEEMKATPAISPPQASRPSPSLEPGHPERPSTAQRLEGSKTEDQDSPERIEQLRRLAEMEQLRSELKSVNTKSPPLTRVSPIKPLPAWARDTRPTIKMPEHSEELKAKIAEKNRREIEEIRRDMKTLNSSSVDHFHSRTSPSTSHGGPQKAMGADVDGRLPFRKPERDSAVSKRKQEIDRMRHTMKLEEASSPVRASRVSGLGAGFDPVGDLKRRRLLSKVFLKFDLDNSGAVDSRELKKLGTTRRTLGHKESVWRESRNLKLLRKIDANHDGQIDKEEFVAHFNEALPAGEADFATIIAQFMDAAAHCRGDCD